jgi:hypothetical protein
VTKSDEERLLWARERVLQIATGLRDDYYDRLIPMHTLVTEYTAMLHELAAKMTPVFDDH